MAIGNQTSSTSAVATLFSIGWFLLIPLYWSVNTFVSFFRPTTGEVARRSHLPCYERPFLLTLAVPSLIVIIALTLPLALIGLCFWIPSRLCKSGYFTVVSADVKPRAINLNLLSQEQFGIVTCNVRLVPEAIARQLNLADTHKRAYNIGSTLALNRLPSESSSGCSCEIDRQSCVHLTSIPRSYVPTHLPSPSSNYEIWPSLTINSDQNAVANSESCIQRFSETKPDCVITIQNGGCVDFENGGSSAVGEVTVDLNGVFELEPNKLHDRVCERHEQIASKGTPCDFTLHVAADVSPKTNSPEANINDNNSTTRDNSLRNSTSSYRSRDSSCFLSIHEDVFEYFLSDVFPNDSDFLCLQDINDPSAMRHIVSQLQSYFPFILYDVGKPSCCTDIFLGSTGLLFASHFPIEKATFKNFSDSFHKVKCISKGILMVKVRLKEEGEKTKGIMGYISVTNLESNKEGGQIRKNQLNEIQEFQGEFRKASRSADSGQDVVAFDILCGDFNFDNESPMDEECWSHSLMSHYQDPCRICQGKDKLWTIGTRINPSQLHHLDVQDANTLKQTLSDVARRGEVIESVQSKVGVTDSQPPNNGKRRTDYILYNLETSDTNLSVDEYHFSTQLATQTDHLAVAMKFHLEERR